MSDRDDIALLDFMRARGLTGHTADRGGPVPVPEPTTDTPVVPDPAFERAARLEALRLAIKAVALDHAFSTPIAAAKVLEAAQRFLVFLKAGG
jgi:hypothetical protein